MLTRRRSRLAPKYTKELHMQNLLTDRVRVLQIAIWFSILGIWLGGCGLDTADARQETGVNASWQKTGGPFSHSPEGYYRLKCGFRPNGSQVAEKGRKRKRRNG